MNQDPLLSPQLDRRGPAKILVVDDSPDEVKLLRDFLMDQGHEAQFAEDGHSALQAVRDNTPDLILLDVNLPDVSGYEVCELIRSEKEFREVPVLFLSGLTGASDKVRAFQAGGVDYITKPFELAEVAARVQTQLELLRQKRALQVSFARLQQLEQLRDNLVHMIVHDLRSSVTTIYMSLDLMAEWFPAADRQVADMLRRARNAANRLSGMTAQVLDISRLESGQMPLNKAEADVTQTVLSAMDSIPVPASALNWRLEAPEPVRASYDSEVIRRVIENLVCNAVKFSPKGSPVIVSVEREGDSARVAVTDSGPGIPADSHTRIFEKFAQLRPENNRLGTGLGLAFCKLAVEAHGGQIGVASKVGQGSTFWFTLPLRD